MQETHCAHVFFFGFSLFRKPFETRIKRFRFRNVTLQPVMTPIDTCEKIQVREHTKTNSTIVCCHDNGISYTRLISSCSFVFCFFFAVWFVYYSECSICSTFSKCNTVIAASLVFLPVLHTVFSGVVSTHLPKIYSIY